MDREALIAAMQATAAAKPVPVKVKAWGGTVYVRAVKVSEVEQQNADTADKSNKNRLARAAARVICDESGKLYFDETNADDIALIAEQPWPVMNKVLSASGSIEEEGKPGN